MNQITESVEHPMIDVDGVMKHRHNSDGKPIHHNDDGIRNFHKWFGDSKVVDEHGRPQVLYHGTNNDFDEFDFNKSRENKTVWTSTHRTVASDFALYRTTWNGANVMPIYIKSKTQVVKPDWELIEWKGNKYWRANKNDEELFSGEYVLKFFMPATEDEYLSYIKI